MNTTETQNLITEATNRTNGTTNEEYGTNEDVLEALIDEHAEIAVATTGMEIMIRDTRDRAELESAHDAMRDLIKTMAATIKELRSAAQDLATKETLKTVKATFAEWGQPQRATAVTQILEDLEAHLYS